jgi:hypothetical protein
MISNDAIARILLPDFVFRCGNWYANRPSAAAPMSDSMHGQSDARFPLAREGIVSELKSGLLSLFRGHDVKERGFVVLFSLGVATRHHPCLG